MPPPEWSSVTNSKPAVYADATVGCSPLITFNLAPLVRLLIGSKFKPVVNPLVFTSLLPIVGLVVVVP